MLHFLYFIRLFRLQVFFTVFSILYLFAVDLMNTDVGQCKTSSSLAISTRVLWSPAALCLDACLSWSDCNRTTFNPYTQVIIWWICILFPNKISNSSKTCSEYFIWYLLFTTLYCSFWHQTDFHHSIWNIISNEICVADFTSRLLW